MAASARDNRMSKVAAPRLEPTLEALASPLRRYLLATRPAFLSIALAGCLLGFSSALDAAFSWTLALLTGFLAVATQAGVNVLNDYCDHLNGSDAVNVDRLFPFTGGSRFIQNGVMSPRRMLAYALVLFSGVIAGGLWLIATRGGSLFGIGLAGLLIGWAYSAPPLKLCSRGLGEPCVAAGFLLIVAGADFVQRGAISPRPWLLGLPYALLVTNILYINQFPDRAADILAGKRHWWLVSSRPWPHEAIGCCCSCQRWPSSAWSARVSCRLSPWLPCWPCCPPSRLAGFSPPMPTSRPGSGPRCR
jgi:1,4-dihydroxy-2-naphthoate octaprenyltransferase